MNYIEVAIAAAKQAGSIHKKYFQTDIVIEEKSSSFDLITVADLESEKAIVATIRTHFPEHNILAEENKYGKTDSEFTWVIDPLDGTNNFACGLPIFCVSIALVHRDKTLLGVIYELFTAEAGAGAFLNNKKFMLPQQIRLRNPFLLQDFIMTGGRIW